MNRARQSVAVALLSIGMLVTSAAWVLAKTPVGQQTAAPDNTKTNLRDRSDNAVTADQQKENRTPLAHLPRNDIPQEPQFQRNLRYVQHTLFRPFAMMKRTSFRTNRAFVRCNAEKPGN